ncbi:hypothetical protein EVAR_29438_1 [Eumeta japonica]|uniref:Chitin-binding type-2 domain-containing protein n=1 Tax=Eumeta variegata TaxID=151549 RepID=A0A4C1VTQ0_EUMVA|nr:hypothetical protein EVAR_29438_1 [Eumeta japonica]
MRSEPRIKSGSKPRKTPLSVSDPSVSVAHSPSVTPLSSVFSTVPSISPFFPPSAHSSLHQISYSYPRSQQCIDDYSRNFCYVLLCIVRADRALHTWHANRRAMNTPNIQRDRMHSNAFECFNLNDLNHCTDSMINRVNKLLCGSLAAHSERSRQRSGPIRSVPVAADIKRDADFDCPEEFGYYPHPEDCTLYYVCVFGGALLESCTGGLMYSHELQTCDWPRNVGCDVTGASAVGGDVERYNEREPPPPPPPRRAPAPPPPPPRAQPKPVITSRGQPKSVSSDYVIFDEPPGLCNHTVHYVLLGLKTLALQFRAKSILSRCSIGQAGAYIALVNGYFNPDEQELLYSEVDDLPPIEEIESDRQQRVYRGQPSTIGQVQRDRDGYSSQINSGRNINSNIIPASISQGNGKIGSFSFGTQVDDRRTVINDRRTASITQAPQTYSVDRIDVTDRNDHYDIETNEIDVQSTRGKREVVEIVPKNSSVKSNDEININLKNVSGNSYFPEKKGDIERRSESIEEEYKDDNMDDIERGKRQVRQGRYLTNKNGNKNKDGKLRASYKQTYDETEYNTNPFHSSFYHQHQPVFDTSNSYENSNVPLVYTTKENIIQFPDFSQTPFKPSLPDPYDQRYLYAPMNVPTQIITKSPPISSLTKNNNPFLVGGFYNNAQSQKTQNDLQNQFSSPLSVTSDNKSPMYNYQDSAFVQTTIVTNKPVLMRSPRPKNKQRADDKNNENSQKENHNLQISKPNSKLIERQPSQKINEGYKEKAKEESSKEVDSNEDSSSEEENDNQDNSFKHDFPEPPYEFTHPSNKYADIKNPFADPNFDFDAFLSKLRNDHLSVVGAPDKPKKHDSLTVNEPGLEVASTPSIQKFETSTKENINYKGMSTPKPFTVPTKSIISWPAESKSNRNNEYTNKSPITENYYEQSVQVKPQHLQQYVEQPKILQTPLPQQNSMHNLVPINKVSLATNQPNQNQPTVEDNRRLPVNYNYEGTLDGILRPPPQIPYNVKYDSAQSVNPSVPKQFLHATKSPIVFPSSSPQIVNNSPRIIQSQPQSPVTKNPYLVPANNPQNGKLVYQQQISANPTRNGIYYSTTALTPYKEISNDQILPSPRPIINPNLVQISPTEANFFSSTYRPLIQSYPSTIANINQNTNYFRGSTTSAPLKKRPIPKPSPEMNDYYYDNDDQYYYEPPVKSKYMPSSEVKPQRPPMAQNYQEYVDDVYIDDVNENFNHQKNPNFNPKQPLKYDNYGTEISTNKYNELSSATKAPYDQTVKNHVNGKIPIPVLVDFGTPPTRPTLIRPETPKHEVTHSAASGQNRTSSRSRKPVSHTDGPNTPRPPKYLNETTLRPYTVRHRLAKTTTAKTLTSDDKVTTQKVRGRTKLDHTPSMFKSTTSHDSQNQETRLTKTRHDDKTNSLEPTESLTPVSYSASPRPKMLYNGSQNYTPEQYDPYYAIYDEDGELYKDTDYVQQYNTASVRPAVQQTYRGTPPPARRPAAAYTPRPSTADDYDDALIQGQINTQSQYQTAVRQSTRGDGNELGYDHNPSSVRTTLYEATTKSTTPPTTTSTSTTTTTTPRPTTAPFTEAMTPSRYTQRYYKRFQHRHPYSFEKQPEDNVYEKEKKNAVSFTTGFSIRRDGNDDNNNTYTLTVITRPFQNSDGNNSKTEGLKTNHQTKINRFYYKTEDEGYVNPTRKRVDKTLLESDEKYTQAPLIRRTDSQSVYNAREDDFPRNLNLKQSNTREQKNKRRRIKNYVSTTTVSSTTVDDSNVHKYYLKTVLRRPAPFSTDNSGNPDNFVEKTLEDARNNDFTDNQEIPEILQEFSEEKDFTIKKNSEQRELPVSPYKSLNNLRNDYITQRRPQQDFPTTRSYYNFSNKEESYKNNREVTTQNLRRRNENNYIEGTTEVFSTATQRLINVLLNNFTNASNQVTSSYPRTYVTTTSTTTTSVPPVNIADYKQTSKYNDDYSISKTNFRTLETTSENHLQEKVHSQLEIDSSAPLVEKSEKSPHIFDDSRNPFVSRDNYENEKDNITNLDFNEPQYIVNTEIKKDALASINQKTKELSNPVLIDYNDKEVDISYNKIDYEAAKPVEPFISTPSKDDLKPDFDDNTDLTTSTENFRLATTELTTRSTITTTTTLKSISFPTRPSRVNPAIKMAAANPGGGRRSYQSSKCSSDNSLQANPKCNEIKYQRPTTPRGRGSAHYSVASEAPVQQNVGNRGTPPTRSRPTLKPSTAIVSKASESVDIYAYPPRRPAPVYPQPTPDKTAAKCRKDVCLLPDCYCGGKDIPGDLPVESVPQIVLLTFDDSVNDLNKGLYADLFEKGRVNPNGCPIAATFYVSHEWTDYSQVQNLYAAGHEMASHTISHSFGEQFSQKKWNREVGGQREILSAYGGVKLEDVRGMRAPFLSVGGNKMFKMLYDSNFTYDSSMPVYENKPPSWPYTLDYKLFHDCMIPPCPTKSYPGVWEVPMVMWQDLNGGRCSMGDACANPPNAEGVYKMILKNFDRHYTSNRAPFGLYYHAAWFTQPHHKEGFIMFLDTINRMPDVWLVTNWQALQWVRDPTPISRLSSFQPFQCNYPDRPKKCNNPKVCNLWHKSGVRYMRTCQPCPEVYPWTGKTGIRSSRIDNDIEE